MFPWLADIPEGISRISVPPRRERLLIRLHSHHVNATLTRTAGRKGLRSIYTQIQGKQDVYRFPDDIQRLHPCEWAYHASFCSAVGQRQEYILHEGGSQAYAQLIQEQRLPETPSAQDVSAAKAKLGRTAGSWGIYSAKVPAQMDSPTAACILQVLLVCKAIGPPFPSTDQVVMNAARSKQLMFIAREFKLSGSNRCAAVPFGCLQCHLAQSQ